MRQRVLLSVILATATLKSFSLPPVDEGKAIFSMRCGSCHNINKVVVGPALAGVDQRHSIDWIIKFVQSSQAVIKSGDTAALALFAKFNNMPMPDHTDLTADNIKSILEFIKNQSSASATPDKAPFARPYKSHPSYTPILISNYGFFLTYFSLVAVLIFVLLLFVRVKEYERNKTSES
ncbi:MAG: cytochrome c [Flavitalea sp.]